MRLDKLQYQLDAIDAVTSVFNQDAIHPNENRNANPAIEPAMQGIDVKMETGTGKTYVYTRLMHELKARFGFFKFIILVPSLAIKEGVKMSIASPDWVKHFRGEFNNQEIRLGVVNAGDFDTKKGKRKQMPEALRSFCDGNSADEKSIEVILLNDAMLASKSMTANDYDSTLFGSINCPLEGLRQTCPIVIIDEPHRFNKDNKAWQNITEGLKPQLIIRFGATFPERVIGRGKSRIVEKDYERGKPVYDLNAITAFNDGLVKGVSVMYPALDKKDAAQYKVDSFIKGKGVKFITKQDGKTVASSAREIQESEPLSLLDPEFDGTLKLEFDNASPSHLKLSNGLAVDKGMILSPQIYSESYQELLLRQALEAHFENEKKNFNRANKIKTVSLFFIDDIASFRSKEESKDNENKGWLRVKFEQLLKEKLVREIKEAQGEYRAFLEASLKSASETIAGYFAEDNEKSDVKIKKEVDDILRNKEEMLSFKNSNGEWNIRRFLFSKWTLKEGWDNPNVFVICKLRSSGSDISKLQEVGRGLRLPFDENGARISNEDFYLTYLIDYSERDFAKKLVGEINRDGGVLEAGKVTETILKNLVENQYASTEEIAKGRLLCDGIIDIHDSILDAEKLIALLPENKKLKLQRGKIIGEGLPKRPKVALNKANFEKIRDLWNQVTKRFLLSFNEVDENTIKEALRNIFAASGVFVPSSVSINEDRIDKSTTRSVSSVKGQFRELESPLSEMPYGEFLKEFNRRTDLPIRWIHGALCDVFKNKKLAPNWLNKDSLENCVKRFEQEFAALCQKFSYQALDFSAQTSLFKEDGNFVDALPQGDVGINEANDIRRDKSNYFYDKFVYDTEIEHEVLKVDPSAKVVVYGKLPRRSIKLPTYTGGTTSPDFVYAIKGDGGAISIHLIVETKSDNPRLSDQIAVNAQKKAFAKIANIEWRMETDVKQFERDLKELGGA
jgi:type III restriction enzyme